MQAAPEQRATFDEPASYWHATAGAGVPAGELPATAHVAVIGGGALRADGFTGATHVDRAGVQELIATPLGPEIAGGVHSTDGGLLHSARFVQGVAAAAQRRGARLAHARVARLAPDGAGVRVETTAGALRAGAAIVAVNAWTDTLVPALRGLITPVRGQVLAYAPLPPVFPLGVGAAVT